MTLSARLTTPQLATLAGISESKARRALARALTNLPWRGANLDVLERHGQGGNSGRVYEVAVGSLPQELQDAYWANFSPPDSDPSPRYNTNAQAEFKLSVLQSVRRLVAAGHTNAAAIKQAATEARYPYGKKRGKPPSDRAVWNWDRAYERDAAAGLMRKQRNDTGKARVIISGQHDALVAEAGLSVKEHRRFRRKLDWRIKGEWQRGEKSWRTVQMNIRPDLMEWTRAVLPDVPEDALREACLVPRALIEKHRRHRAVAIRRENAGLSAAVQTPRIKRDRSRMRPGDGIAADVWHLDNLVQRADGTLATPKAVAWLDLATNRAFISFFLMKPGEMIATRHVAESFAEMAADPNWGVPSWIYADRGGEYNWLELTKDLTQLKRRIEVRDWSDSDDHAAGLRRSRPYNPQSKVIESSFAALRFAFGQLSGYIGGDRFHKKTQNQGKAAVPYRGGFESFKRAAADMLHYHHTKRQSGHLAGKSPYEHFAEFVAEGWQSVVLDPDELAIAFSIEDSRWVTDSGTFEWKGVTYRHDDLLSFAAVSKVRVHQPIYGDRSRLFVFDDDGQWLCVAEPEEYYDFDDPRGAAEQQRRNAELNRQIRALEAEGDRRDPEEVIARAVEACGPVPHATASATISISPQYRKAALAYKALGATPPVMTDAEKLQRRQYEILKRLAPASESVA